MGLLSTALAREAAGANSGVLAVAGCCVLLVGAAWADDKGGYAGYVFVFIWLPAGVCLICVAVVVLIVGALAAQL